VKRGATTTRGKRHTTKQTQDTRLLEHFRSSNDKEPKADSPSLLLYPFLIETRSIRESTCKLHSSTKKKKHESTMQTTTTAMSLPSQYPFYNAAASRSDPIAWSNNETTTPEPEFINLIDFIRGDGRLPERYVFSSDDFPDYSRATQRRLVAVIQHACELQQSPINVHQWANAEHDDRSVRRIRFRCAFFRKKKRLGQNGTTCLFNFQVCYMENVGWCLFKGKGQHRHNGHALGMSKSTSKLPKRTVAKAVALKRSKVVPQGKAVFTTVQPPLPQLASEDATEFGFCLPTAHAESLANALPVKPEEPAAKAVAPASPTCATWIDEKNDTMEAMASLVPAALDGSRGAQEPWSAPIPQELPLFTDFALDPAHLDEAVAMDLDLWADNAVVTASEESSCGLLHKTVVLEQAPFPEVTNLDDKCLGIIEALRVYSQEHNFVVTLEDYYTVDRPFEKTIRVVLHCLGNTCYFQVALLWVIGLTTWQIYCQPDGIFVHGCGRLESKESAEESAAVSPLAATSPSLYRALDHLVDFLNGEVVCPDREVDNSAWKCKGRGKVSEKVRKETRKAVAKATGVDAASAA
jgi:hypothetical protein